MASMVKDLQKDIVSSKKSVTEILRTAKVIAAKLNLTDILGWLNHELKGYIDSAPPEYRILHGGTLQVLNPTRGWQTVGHVNTEFPIYQSIPDLENLMVSEHSGDTSSLVLPIQNKYPISSLGGANHIAMNFSQQVVFASSQLRPIVETVKERVLEWCLELEKRSIVGEDFSFNEKERESATKQVFNIQQFSGVIGNVTHTSTQVFNYTSIHQTLKQLGITQAERNALEDIMDSLAKATPEEKPSLSEKAKAWVVKNKEFLGTSIELVKKALGME